MLIVGLPASGLISSGLPLGGLYKGGLLYVVQLKCGLPAGSLPLGIPA